MISNDSVFIPESLKAMRNWCAWKLEESNGSITKMPYQCNGRRASSTNRNTWTDYTSVSELLSITDQYSGFGFMIADNIVFVDVDHCIDDNGTMDKRGADILSAFPLSFAEISQSGTGLHILAMGTIPRSFKNTKQGIEVYSNARFCAMTGNAIQENEPTTEQDGLDYVFNKYGNHARKTNSFSSIDAISTHSDRWVISHASERGIDFQKLFFNGDASDYGSQSEADEALAVLLAFWCDRDPVQIDRLFRQSSLYRSKWEREDYRIRTIAHACEHITESVSEWMKRNYNESCQSASAMDILAFGKRADDSE